METRKYQAAEKKRCNSHNCAQAVVCTYCDLVGLPEQTALDIPVESYSDSGSFFLVFFLRESF
ncbi:MAG: hypothetical protein IKM75_00665 [Bacteroidales bacterium]|nr:hypothetical protein [Bacteroidales bacterium]